MNRVCRPMLDKSVIVFIDDFLVYSKSKEEHEVHLREVLETLWKERLYAKFSKCEFWLQEVQFLGHVINSEGFKVDPSKIEVVMNWQAPKSVITEANVVADALSRKEIKKVTRIRSLRMIVTSDLFDGIKADQVEALEEENWKSERIASYIPHLEDDSRGFKTRNGRVYIPFRSNVKEFLLDEAHKSKYSIHPGATKMYLDLKKNYWWPVYHANVSQCHRKRCSIGDQEVSNTDESSVITLDDIKIDPELTSREEPETILGRKSRQLRNKVISLVKVQWKHCKGTSIRWEPEEKMRIKYLHLF
ncbi:putative reverse transcriptase domain-containing protein [Tanacetum coccineum]